MGILPAVETTTGGRSAARTSSGEWCPGRDLNPDELPHTPLKRTRIPIPPPGQGARSPASAPRAELVPREGVEATRPCDHWYLKPARLPFRHLGSTTGPGAPEGITGPRRGAMLAHP